MINKLRILGEYVQQNEGDSNLLDLNQDLKEANVIIVNFLLNNDNCELLEFDILEFDPLKNEKILYKGAGGQKKSPFPTYNAFYNRDEKKCRKNIEKAFNKFLITLENNSKINSALNPIVDFLKIEENKIIVRKGIYENISAQTSNLFTIKINGLFIGESEIYKEIINHYIITRDDECYKKYNTKSLGSNERCYICGKVSEKLYGFCDTFKFYSANETAYIAGGFTKEKTWKNYPVCPECVKYLRIAREKLNRHFNRFFYGNKYYLIPVPTLDNGSFYTILQIIEEDLKRLSLSKQQESNQQIRSEMEDEILETLAHQGDQITFTFFFYAASNSEFKIIQEAEDILPSRFKKIIGAKKKIEHYNEFQNLKGLYKRGESANLSFNFGIVKTFFPSNFNNDFLDIVTKIFKGQKISKSFILHQISEHLAKGFRNEKLFHDIEKAMIFLKFLYELDLIENTKQRLEIKMENKYEDYFQTHPEFYDADWKKAVFLTGVLAQHVMDIQYRERKATPFRSRLNGLKLDHRVIKRLLPESIEKLEQYKSNYYRELEEVISRLMESGEPDIKQQSVDEISFFFTMGMNLNKQFKSNNENEGEDDE